MSKKFVFTIPIEGFEEITISADSLEEALERIRNGEHDASYVSEVFWQEDPTEDHLLKEE